ncbi:hypothetical protein [Lysinibacillus xylanilyticus]|uniref:hypothetical protein n=1 Tax=Lysinibacillus xylanilyticus TaxID=582475 RepID=UPI003D073D73
MIGLNKEKVINLGGLIDILNLDNPTVTLSNTNGEAVSYDFDADNKTIKLKNLKEGFSNIQVNLPLSFEIFVKSGGIPILDFPPS